MGRVRWGGEVGVGEHAWDRRVFFGGCLRGEWPPIDIGGYEVGDTPGTGVVLCRGAGDWLHGEGVIGGRWAMLLSLKCKWGVVWRGKWLFCYFLKRVEEAGFDWNGLVSQYQGATKRMRRRSLLKMKERWVSSVTL